MWAILMYVTMLILGLSLLYLSNRINKFNFTKQILKTKYPLLCNLIIVVCIFLIIAYFLNFINAIVVAVYFSLCWLISDFIFFILKHLFKTSFTRYYAGVIAIISAIFCLLCGWYLDQNVWQTNYIIHTNKNVEKLRIAMFADAHIGTTFNAKEFANHLQKIQSQNPDILLIAGDFIDDDTNKSDMIEAIKSLNNIKTKYGIYFVFGNHDKGYFSALRRGYSAQDVISELEKNKIQILQDDIKEINNYYIIGRRDKHDGKMAIIGRKSMQELMQNLDDDKYSIIIDHQPADYNNQILVNADLVLSGHTHGGQLFPFNYVGKWIGANDQIYGHSLKKNTHFIVTSGISNWKLNFKTGTKSEFVIIDILPDKI